MLHTADPVFYVHQPYREHVQPDAMMGTDVESNSTPSRPASVENHFWIALSFHTAW